MENSPEYPNQSEQNFYFKKMNPFLLGFLVLLVASLIFGFVTSLQSFGLAHSDTIYFFSLGSIMFLGLVLYVKKFGKYYISQKPYLTINYEGMHGDAVSPNSPIVRWDEIHAGAEFAGTTILTAGKDTGFYAFPIQNFDEFYRNRAYTAFPKKYDSKLNDRYVYIKRGGLDATTAELAQSVLHYSKGKISIDPKNIDPYKTASSNVKPLR